MKIFKIIFLFSIFIFIPFKSNSIENKIELKINNKIITSIDIKNEIKIIKLLNKNLQNNKNEDLLKIAKNSLIKQRIQEIELLKYNEEIVLEEKVYKPYLNNYIERLGFNNNAFQEYVVENDIDLNSIKKKIIVELLWNSLIYKKFAKNVKIDENKIRSEILKKDKQNEYLLSEIVFDIKNKDEFNKKLDLIFNDIKTKGFEKSALEHSISDSSKNGGKLGWIKETSLSPKINSLLKKIKINQITKPLQIPGGFLIIKINDIRQTKNNLDIEKEVNQSLRERTNKQLDQLSNIYLGKIKKNIVIDEF